MRVLVVATLLFFNVALALWQAGRPPGGESVAGAPPDGPTGTQPLRLLSERRGIPQARDESPRPDPSPAPDPAPPATPSALACGRIGPFPADESARALARRLTEQGWRARVEGQTVEEIRYWVLLPPFPTAADAFAAERALRDAGIRDLQVLAGEGRDHALSLGLFRDRAAARRRLDQIRALGFAPQLEPLERRRAQFWVRFAADRAEVAHWDPAAAPDAELSLQREPCVEGEAVSLP